jgi:hypothetical protein
MNPDNPLVRSHVRRGGVAAVFDQGYLSILQQDWIHRIEKVERVTHTLGGCAPFMIANALAASLAAFVQGVKVEQIRAALHSFQASVDQEPGQINLLNLEHYHFDLLKQYPNFKDAQASTLEALLSQPVSGQQPSDRLVPSLSNGADNGAAIGFEKGLPREELCSAIAQGSLHSQNGLKAGSLSAVQDYPTKQSVDDRDRLEAQAGSQNHAPQSNTVAAAPETTTVTPTHDVAREFDFPADATTHPEPVRRFANTVQTKIETIRPKVIAAQEILGLSLKNFTTFAKTVKQRGFKTWAADRSAKAREWATEQAPVASQVAIDAARKIAEQAFKKGAIAGTIALALGRAVADAALEKGTELGAIAWEKFEKATQLVDPVTLDPALKDAIVLFGKGGRFEGEVFVFQQTETGVAVHLKDGTSIYADGKLNLHGDGRLTYRLSKIPENVAQVKADVRRQLTAQNYPNNGLRGGGAADEDDSVQNLFA